MNTPDINEAALSQKNAEYRPKKIYGLVIFSLIMLFNPNINLIDFFPDFIAYFILAKVFEMAADAAPYFEEARVAFVKLGYINIAKIPALIIITVVRSGNTLDNDIVALMSLVFAAMEIIFLIPAVKNIFDALFYLGERTDAESLIKNDSLICTEVLRSFTLVFTIFKCILYSLPEMLRLTRSVEIGTTTSMLTGSRFYPWAVLASIVLGFVIGSVWLSRMVKYVKKIKSEGKFASSVISLASENSFDEYEKKIEIRSIGRSFLMFILASVFSIDLIFTNYNEINLLPNFIFGIFFTIGLISLTRHMDKCEDLKKYSLIAGIAFIIASAVNYFFSTRFLMNYGFDALLENENAAAVKAYGLVEILSVAETLLYIALIGIFFLTMKRFISERLGHAERHGTLGAHNEYYKELNKKTAFISILASVAGICGLINVFINGNVKIIFTNPDDVTMPTLTVSALPWFSLVVTAMTCFYIFFSVYYFNTIKEELQ